LEFVAVSHVLIHKRRQFSLWPQSVRTLDAFIVHADQELPAFLELEAAIKTHRHNHECDCPEPNEELGRNGCQSHQGWLEVGLPLSKLILTGKTIWIADAHRDDGRRFVVRANEN
jgi:hypothetical protein